MAIFANVELRRRVQVGLNKGEAKNAPARAVFLNRLGELRDRRNQVEPTQEPSQEPSLHLFFLAWFLHFCVRW